MNLPFIEHRVVSIHLNGGALYWVELSQLGSRVRLINKGKLPWQQDLDQSLKELRDAIEADIFQVSLSAPELVEAVRSEEIPFSEDPDEVERWIDQRKKELGKEFDKNTEVYVHIAQVEEEVQRALFQIIDTVRVQELEDLFKGVSLPLLHIYSGVTEYGYAHMLNPKVVEGLQSVWFEEEGTGYLLHYNQGMIQQIHSLGEVEGGLSSDHLSNQVQALIQSEELAHQLEQGSTILYVQVESVGIGERRPVSTLEAFDGKAPFDDVQKKYLGALGAGIKSFYPELDTFDLVSATSREQALEIADKQSFFKAGVLLLVPLFFFLLVSYAWNSVIEYKLQETSQVMSAIEDKLDQVQAERAEVRALFTEYKELQGVTTTQTNTAKVFTALNETVEKDIVIKKLVLESSTDPSFAGVTLSGISGKEIAISTFMRALSEHKWTKEPQLLESKVGKNGMGIEFVIEMKVNTE